MAIDTSQWAADLSGCISDLPASATFNGQFFTCSVAPLGVTQDVFVTGDLTKYRYEAVIPLATLTAASVAALATQARIAIKAPFDTAAGSTGNQYEILEVSKSPDGVQFNLVLKYDHRLSGP